MPIIDHSNVPMSEVVNYQRERTLVSNAQGAVSLTIKELELQPGWEGRLHTHPTDIAIMVTAGAVQMVLDDEVTTIRAGTTILAPPGVPHKLVNQLWIPVRILVSYPTTDLTTDYLE
jgi:quercetin dioxygenase-like cupin family protein